MAHAAKYAASATGHMLSHYDRSKSHLGENIDPERTNLNYNLAPHREGGQLEFMHKRADSGAGGQHGGQGGEHSRRA